MPSGTMKVGQLARRTGLTVRTLHYYEEIGLLTPSQRTDTGHRLYGAEDVRRLQQVMLLRHMGFPLEDIRNCLDAPGFSFHDAIQVHQSRLREQIELLKRLHSRLDMMAQYLRTEQEISVDEFLNTIQVMTMYEKYYTPEQMAKLEERRRQVGDERIQQVQQEWSDLYAQARAEMEKGADPCSEPVQRLVEWSERLIGEFTGGDPEIRSSLERMYQQEGPAKASHGAIDVEAFEYMQKARDCKEARK